MASILQTLQARLRERPGLAEVRALAAWEAVAGPRILAHARAENLRDGVLTVRVRSSVWLHELAYLKGELIARVRDFLGDDTVREIRCVAGSFRSDVDGHSVEPPCNQRVSDGHNATALLGHTAASALPRGAHPHCRHLVCDQEDASRHPGQTGAEEALRDDPEAARFLEEIAGIADPALREALIALRLKMPRT